MRVEGPEGLVARDGCGSCVVSVAWCPERPLARLCVVFVQVRLSAGGRQWAMLDKTPSSYRREAGYEFVEIWPGGSRCHVHIQYIADLIQ